MLHRISWRVVLPAALTAIVFSFPVFGQPQDQQTPSVAEAARRAREQKKKSEKPARVVTEDNLKPATPETVTSATAELPRVPGSPASDAQGKPANGSAPSENSEKKESAAKSAEAASMKAQLEELEKELDLLRREVPLERDNYYSKQDYARDTAGKSKLDALQQQLTDKQQNVDALKARLAPLLEQLAKEQPASPENSEKPATPPQP